MFETIRENIKQSIDILKNSLSKDELDAIKKELINIYNYESSTSASYANIQQSTKITTDKIDLIEEAFYNVGNHIAIPSRTGTTDLLDESYEIDFASNPNYSFADYQQEVIGYVYEQVNSI